MKTRKSPAKSQSKLVLQLSSWGCYLSETARLEALLQKKPGQIRIELIGIGEMPSDTVLLIRSILQARSPRTRLITHARSSLQGAAVLVWLLGDQRLIRDDARLLFRAAGPFESGETSTSWRASNLSPDEELESEDYIRALQLINEFLPVRELAGSFIAVPTLRQFGLVDSEKADEVLKTLLGRQKPSAVLTTKEPKKKCPRGPTRKPGSRSAGKPSPTQRRS